MGQRLRIPDLPTSHPAWLADRARHLAADLAPSRYTTDLYRQYRHHLGGPRYALLRGVQGLVVPPGALLPAATAVGGPGCRGW